MNTFLRYIFFFVANFGALALGALFTGKGVTSDWYQNMNQAPWTPPGWIFGAAWTTIMIFYSIYMGAAWKRVGKRKMAVLFGFQWLLNVAWNPAFFYFRETTFALLLISALTLFLVMKFFFFKKEMGWRNILLLPYIVWLCIATSLNLYIVAFN